MKRILQLLIMSLVLPSCATTGQSSPIKSDETVLFFPTNAYQQSGSQQWIIPIHGWIFELEDDSLWRQSMIDQLPGILEVEVDETDPSPLYRERGRMFLVDNERGKSIDVILGKKRYSLVEASGPNGHFRGTIRADSAKLASDGGWITYQAVMKEGDSRQFSGQAQLIGPQGISVISDIDDTIKISNVEDKRELLANTFFRPSRPVPGGMPEIYQQWAQQGAVFHYLSASPWQLYPALSDFISKSGFPQGSIDLKTFRTKDQTFFNLFTSQEAYKKPLIDALFKSYPGRRFVLVGDAGEVDPDIFAAVARDFPDQIIRIFIRDTQPNAAQSERYPVVFKGIPKDRWTIFQDGNDLLKFDITSAAQSTAAK